MENVTKEMLEAAVNNLSSQIKEVKDYCIIGIGEDSIKVYVQHWSFKKIIPDTIDNIRVDTIVTGKIKPATITST